tara:strand:+ start:207 stop:653 length:447 start_codon:yes stop_codon:yes gene_type:complete
MAVHRHSSWGRTRSPKNLAGSQGGTVTPVEALSSLAGVTAATSGVQGYATENQRFLHVLVEDSAEDDGETVTVFGYCHAFLRWFPLSTTIGGATEVSIAGEDASSTAPASQTPDKRQYRCYEIAGIDRVAFVCADASEVNIFAACSTF